MKNLLILTALALSFSASAADTTLLMLKRSSGFSPRPQAIHITISENGSIVRTVSTMREVTKETLGKLSVNAINSIKDKIETIDDNAVLVNPNPKAPKCMDAPSTTVAVNKGGKQITLKLRASCQTSTVDSVGADQLINLITAFETL